MSHAIRHLDYHCSVSEKAILKDINSFAYDPQETIKCLEFLDEAPVTVDPTA